MDYGNDKLKRKGMFSVIHKTHKNKTLYEVLLNPNHKMRQDLRQQPLVGRGCCLMDYSLMKGATIYVISLNILLEGLVVKLLELEPLYP